MKQYITREQLDELSEGGKERLLDWWQYSSGGFVVDYLGGCGDSDHCESIVSSFADIEGNLLSIGQMIEFLFDNDYGPQIHSNDTAFYWTVEPEKKLDCWKKDKYENSELCDALWEAVKEILEK